MRHTSVLPRKILTNDSIMLSLSCSTSVPCYCLPYNTTVDFDKHSFPTRQMLMLWVCPNRQIRMLLDGGQLDLKSQSISIWRLGKLKAIHPQIFDSAINHLSPGTFCSLQSCCRTDVSSVCKLEMRLKKNQTDYKLDLKHDDDGHLTLDLLSRELTGKDWRHSCTQYWTLTYPLHATVRLCYLHADLLDWIEHPVRPKFSDTQLQCRFHTKQQKTSCYLFLICWAQCASRA